MTCEVCSDKGIVRLNWADAPDDYAVCLCEEGLRLRVDRNVGKTVSPLWMLWCAREQVHPSRMFLIEEVLTPVELTERELRKPAVSMSREAALLNIGKQKPRR